MQTVIADKSSRIKIPDAKPGQVFAYKIYPEQGIIRLCLLKDPNLPKNPHDKVDASSEELAAHWDQFGPAPDVIFPNDKI